MAVRPSNAYGAIVRKTERTLALLDRFCASADPETEDDWLRAVCLGAHGGAVRRAVQDLEADGLIQGHDFVLTHADFGVLEELPDWLDSSGRDDDERYLRDDAHAGLWDQVDGQLQSLWLESLRLREPRYAHVLQLKTSMPGVRA